MGKDLKYMCHVNVDETVRTYLVSAEKLTRKELTMPLRILIRNQHWPKKLKECIFAVSTVLAE